MRNLIIVILFCSCNLSSRLPFTIKNDADGLFDYYIGKARYYAIKYDTMKVENEYDSSLFILRKIYYGMKAEENVVLAKRYLQLLKEQE